MFELQKKIKEFSQNLILISEKKEFSPKVVDQIDQILAKKCHFDRKNDRRSFYDHSQKIWATITHDHDCQIQENMSHIHLMIVIWSEMIGDHDQITLSLHILKIQKYVAGDQRWGDLIMIADHFRSDHDHDVNMAHIFLNLAIMIVSDRGS